MSELRELARAVSSRSKSGRYVWIMLGPLYLLEGLFALLMFVVSGALIRLILRSVIEWIMRKLREDLAAQADAKVFWKIIDGRTTEQIKPDPDELLKR